MPRTSCCSLDVVVLLPLAAVLLAAHVAWGQTVNVFDQQGQITGQLTFDGMNWVESNGSGGALFAPQSPIYNEPAPIYVPAVPQCSGSSTLIIIGGRDRRRPNFGNRPSWGGGRDRRQYRQPPQWGYGGYGQPVIGPQNYGGYDGNSLGALQAQNEALQRQLDNQRRWQDELDRNNRLRQELGRYGY